MVARKAFSRSVRSRTHTVALVATRKGAWLYHGDAARKTWRVDGPHFLGHIINHLVLDPRDGRTLLAAAKTGHLGPTVFRSTDLGRTWKEAARPPAFAKAPDGEKGRAVDHTFWLTPATRTSRTSGTPAPRRRGCSAPKTAASPGSRSPYINDDPQYRAWMGTVQDGTPDGPKLHSIIVDPRDPSASVFRHVGRRRARIDGRRRHLAPLVKGLEVVEGFDRADIDLPRSALRALCPSNPDRLYQQNHCGIYRLDRPSDEWVRIGKNMPKQVGDIGFPMVVHPRDADTAWVFPMDGTTVWPRTSPDGKPAAYVTRNGGKTWQRLDAGLPGSQAWWTVKRQAMTADARDPVGLYFGTTSGELWMSRDEGRRWALHRAAPARDLRGGSGRAA